MNKILELGNGISIAKVSIDELKEQELNARVMDTKTFNRLVQNVTKKGQLESLPYCATTENGLEIISGHHRVRACRTANITEIHVLLDESGLTKSEIKAKQLAHNSIEGIDDWQTVKKIFMEIEDAELKLEAHIDENILNNLKFDSIPVESLDLNISYKEMTVLFLPTQKETWETALANLKNKEDIQITTVQDYDALIPIFTKVVQKENIRNIATVFTKIAEIVNQHYENKQ